MPNDESHRSLNRRRARSRRTPHPPRRTARVPGAPSDAELVYAWRTGQRSAADLLVRRHLPRVQRLLRARAGDAADDLTQRAFELALGPSSRFDPETSFAAYIATIARNLACDHFNQAKRRKARLHEWPLENRAPHNGFGHLVQEDRVALLRSIVDGLSGDLRKTVQLFYWGGLSTKEIALELGIPRSTVTSRLWHARELIRESLRGRQGGGSDACPTAFDYLCW